MSTDRRSFIKYAGALLGGTVLAACSTQEPPLGNRLQETNVEPVQTPNGFRFYSLKRDGDPLPDGKTVQNLRYDAVISDNGQIAYTAFDEEGRVGLYRMQVDTSGETPRVLDERLVIAEMQQLPNGGLSTPIGGYHISNNGDVIFAMESLIGDAIPNEQLEPSFEVSNFEADGFANEGPEIAEPGMSYNRSSGIYRASASRGVELLVAAETTTAQGHIIVGNFGPAVTAGKEMLFTAFMKYYNEGSETYDSEQGVFYLEDLEGGAENAVLVQCTGNLPYGLFEAEELTSDNVVQLFGLIDLQPGGNYCIQAHTADPRQMDMTEQASGQVYLGTMLMAGSARDPGSALVLSAPQGLGIAPANHEMAIGLGAANHGPRISATGTMGSIITLSESVQRLYYGSRLVATSGDLSPSGYPIESFLTPSFGPDGEMYVTVQTPNSMELMLFDGVTLRTVLRTNDTLVGETTPVSLITLGTLIRHVNRNSELAFTVVREDGTTALVLGVPA